MSRRGRGNGHRRTPDDRPGVRLKNR
jgi:hypothetical protein